MDNLFLEVLNLTVVGSFVIFGVMIARLLMVKFPRKYSYFLWVVVLVRLLVPIAWESDLSLVPTSSQPIFTPEMAYETVPTVNTGVDILDNAINPILPPVAHPESSVNPIQIWIFLGCVLWVTGMTAMTIYGLVQYFRLKYRLSAAIPLEKGIYLTDNIPSPFVLGLFSPKIYLPSHLESYERDYIIVHEQCHLKRCDHITRVLAFVALTVHWFNPFVWAAFVLSERDMERSCDEAVMRTMEADIRRDYANSLLRFATCGRLISATPLAFGEGDTKGRVKNVISYKKPVVWMTVVAVVVAVCVGVGLLSNAKGQEHGGYAGLNAAIQEIDLESQTILVSALDADSPLGRRCVLVLGEDTNLISLDENNDLIFITLSDFTVGDYVAIDIDDWDTFMPNRGTPSTVQRMETWSDRSQDMDDYTIDQAISDGAFVCGSDGVITGQEHLEALMEAASNREDASLRTVYYLFTDGADDPVLEVSDIVYEDSVFTVTTYPTLPEEPQMVRTYQYLVTENVPLMSSSAQYDQLYTYYLVNDPDITWADIQEGAFSALYGASVDCYIIYKEYSVEERVHPVTGLQENERLLTQAELDYFNGEYFNSTAEGSWNIANQFLNCTFDTPFDVDMLEIFYLGTGEDCAIGQAEYDAVAKAYGFDGRQDLPTDVTAFSSEALLEVLMKYIDVPLESTNGIGMDSFIYLEEYDRYYNMHGDTNYYGDVIFTSGTQRNDTVTLQYYSARYQADYVLTMKMYELDHYTIYANMPVQ